MRTIIALVVASGLAAGCSRPEGPAAPSAGVIPAPEGGASGYQHGSARSKFAFGGDTRRTAEHGYLKVVGPAGTLAVDARNGSVFARPRATAAALGRPPFGATPAAHDRFVADYFAGLGLPRDQILSVRGMTMLDANGRSADRARPRLRLSAYYSVVQRAVGGVAVPDSFAWARVNADGAVVEEGVYWPALPAAALAAARDIAGVLADPRRRQVLDARVTPGSAASVAIRHTAATTAQAFQAMASYDVVFRPGTVGEANAAGATFRAPAGMSYTRHFDANGREFRLPHETLGEERSAGREGQGSH